MSGVTNCDTNRYYKRFDLDCVLLLLQMEFMGVVCRDAVNDCDIPENCTGNSSQVSTSFPRTVFCDLNIQKGHRICVPHTAHHFISEVFFVFFCSVLQMCTRWMATRVKRTR